VVPKYFNCATFWKDPLAIIMSWFCPAFWWRNSNIYLDFSAFTSRTTFLLASIKVSVVFFMVSMLSPVDSHHQHRPAADMSHLS
jgi:hypothetical protein